jgi:hypothetical protein
MRCGHCGGLARVRIPAVPEEVCLDHAIEFWTGLLEYVKERTYTREQIDTSCPGVPCAEQSEANQLPDAASQASSRVA